MKKIHSIAVWAAPRGGLRDRIIVSLRDVLDPVHTCALHCPFRTESLRTHVKGNMTAKTCMVAKFFFFGVVELHCYHC